MMSLIGMTVTLLSKTNPDTWYVNNKDVKMTEDTLLSSRQSTALMKKIHDDIKDTIANLGWIPTMMWLWRLVARQSI